MISSVRALEGAGWGGIYSSLLCFHAVHHVREANTDVNALAHWHTFQRACQYNCRAVIRNVNTLIQILSFFRTPKLQIYRLQRANLKSTLSRNTGNVKILLAYIHHMLRHGIYLLHYCSLIFQCVVCGSEKIGKSACRLVPWKKQHFFFMFWWAAKSTVHDSCVLVLVKSNAAHTHSSQSAPM